MVVRLAVFLCAAGMAVPATAPRAQDLDDPAVAGFVINNTISTLYHEVGHAFVDIYGLPVLGKEEDAVDNLSTLLMLAHQPDEALDQMMFDASDIYYYSDLETQASGYEIGDSDFAGYHGLDMQRYYAVVCVVYGSDPERFQELADDAELDPDRQDSCAFDYEQASTSWAVLLEPHLLANTETAGAFVLQFDEPSAENADLAALAQESPELEYSVAMLNETYALPQDLVITFAECEEENAWYYSSDQSITICYQILAAFQRLITTALAEE